MRAVNIFALLLTAACGVPSLDSASENTLAPSHHVRSLPRCFLPPADLYPSEEVTRIDELPLPVRMKLTHHLHSRLGDILYSQIRFIRGRIYNVDHLPQTIIESSFQAKSAPRYLLQYELPIGEPGFHLYCLDEELGKPLETIYCAQIGLDQMGAVVSEITLPAASHDKTKSDLVSLDSVLKTVFSHSCTSTPDCIVFGYDEYFDSLVWHISCPVTMRNAKNAHTLSVVSAHDSTLLTSAEVIGGTISGGPPSQEIIDLLNKILEGEPESER